MKVIEMREAFMSDYEVLQFLTKLENKHSWDEQSLAEHQLHKKKKIKTTRPYNHPVLQRITRDTVSYLKINKNFIPQEEGENKNGSTKTTTDSSICKFNDESFSQFVLKLNEFKLFKIEKLQIINQLPTNMVHLYSIVEECDSRFSEEEVNKILEIIKEFS